MKTLTATPTSANIDPRYWVINGAPDGATAQNDTTRLSCTAIRTADTNIYQVHVDNLTKLFTSLTSLSQDTQVAPYAYVPSSAWYSAAKNYTYTGDGFIYVNDTSGFAPTQEVIVLEGDSQQNSPAFYSEWGTVGSAGQIPITQSITNANFTNSSVISSPYNVGNEMNQGLYFTCSGGTPTAEITGIVPDWTYDYVVSTTSTQITVFNSGLNGNTPLVGSWQPGQIVFDAKGDYLGLISGVTSTTATLPISGTYTTLSFQNPIVANWLNLTATFSVTATSGSNTVVATASTLETYEPVGTIMGGNKVSASFFNTVGTIQNYFASVVGTATTATQGNLVINTTATVSTTSTLTVYTPIFASSVSADLAIGTVGSVVVSTTSSATTIVSSWATRSSTLNVSAGSLMGTYTGQPPQVGATLSAGTATLQGTNTITAINTSALTFTFTSTVGAPTVAGTVTAPITATVNQNVYVLSATNSGLGAQILSSEISAVNSPTSFVIATNSTLAQPLSYSGTGPSETVSAGDVIMLSDSDQRYKGIVTTPGNNTYSVVLGPTPPYYSSIDPSPLGANSIGTKANITSVTYSGGQLTFNATNSFKAGQTVSVNISGSPYAGIYQIVSTTSTNFVVATTSTTTPSALTGTANMVSLGDETNGFYGSTGSNIWFYPYLKNLIFTGTIDTYRSTPVASFVSISLVSTTGITSPFSFQATGYANTIIDRHGQPVTGYELINLSSSDAQTLSNMISGTGVLLLSGAGVTSSTCYLTYVDTTALIGYVSNPISTTNTTWTATVISAPALVTCDNNSTISSLYTQATNSGKSLYLTFRGEGARWNTSVLTSGPTPYWQVTGIPTDSTNSFYINNSSLDNYAPAQNAYYNGDSQNYIYLWEVEQSPTLANGNTNPFYLAWTIPLGSSLSAANYDGTGSGVVSLQNGTIGGVHLAGTTVGSYILGKRWIGSNTAADLEALNADQIGSRYTSSLYSDLMGGVSTSFIASPAPAQTSVSLNLTLSSGGNQLATLAGANTYGSVTGVIVGMLVQGTGIPSGSVVTSVVAPYVVASTGLPTAGIISISNNATISGVENITFSSNIMNLTADIANDVSVAIIGTGKTQESVLLSGSYVGVDGSLNNVPIVWDLVPGNTFRFDHYAGEPIFTPNILCYTNPLTNDHGADTPVIGSPDTSTTTSATSSTALIAQNI